MAIATLTEGNKYDTTHLSTIVIDLLTKKNAILQNLPFEELMGNSLTYDQITTDSTASFYAPGGTWSESTHVITQQTVTLKILGGDVDIDNFLSRTRGRINVTQTALQNKVKAIKNKFMETFYYGDDSSDANAFDGLQVLMTSTTYNTVHAGSSTGSALSINKVRSAIDLNYADGIELIVMSKLMRRSISTYFDSIGDKLQPVNAPRFGGFVPGFDGIPIVTDDFILDTETAASGAYSASTGGGNTTIFLLNFGPQACCGVQGSNQVETQELGQLETKDATRYRIKWYTGLKLEDLRSCGKVDGVDADGTVTA